MYLLSTQFWKKPRVGFSSEAVRGNCLPQIVTLIRPVHRVRHAGLWPWYWQVFASQTQPHPLKPGVLPRGS